MGYLSCNAESAIATCDSQNWELLLNKKPRKNKPNNRPIKITEFSYSDLHSSTNGFSAGNLLGKGSHGSVYKAHLRHIKLIAAVKVAKQTSPNENEFEILSKIYHPRLVNLLGFAIEPIRKRNLVVVEYMPNGSLHDLLHGPGKPPGWVKRTRFAVQLARAVQFLHTSNPPIIHRDIKSSNVLIDSRFNSRLNDFGLALRGHVEDVRISCTPPAGTLGYLDPCYLAPGDLSTKSDVFSFGILILEIISGRKAIDVNYSPPSVVDWAVPAIKSGEFEELCDPRIGPPVDAESLRRMAILAARCVRSTAAKRPGMAEVMECLKCVYRRTKSRNQGCISLNRRVGRVGEYEPLDESVELVRSSRAGNRKNGKVSNDAGVEMVSNGIGELVRKSKSIGTASEIKFLPLDLVNDHVNKRRGGSGVKMTTVRLNKSRSVGIVQSRRMVNFGKRLEEFKLLEDLGENFKGDVKDLD
ncbi:hypothetical protein RD792_005845 [Penstemon davidsonii]|uniref:Protein kinase domain-containing protein n=1 Tax=Penstemon davidsonii TaxID=160366 RepID=A0ABR0DEW9_9LAMI|nr:hypothetical protein RD792_005845 [Penstemon davidsonii]